MENLKQLTGSVKVTYSPLIASLTGSINSAIFLSQLLYWWERKANGLLYKTIKEIENETMLSRFQQEQSIKKLKELGIIEVYVIGVPPKRHFGINIEKIKELIEDYNARNSQNEMQETNKSICKKLTNQNAGNSQINLQETDKLKCEKLTNQFVRNSQIFTKNTTKITTKTTTENTTKITTKNTLFCFCEKISQDFKKFNFNDFKILANKQKCFEVSKNAERKKPRLKQKKKEINPPYLRPPPLDKENSLHQQLKNIFLDVYSIKTGLPYYWTGKDGKHLSELAEKMRFILQQMQKIPDDSQIIDNFRIILENIQDNWILEHFSVAIINSKFNEIVSKIKNGQNGQQTGKNNISPEFRRKLLETLLGKPVQ